MVLPLLFRPSELAELRSFLVFLTVLFFDPSFECDLWYAIALPARAHVPSTKLTLLRFAAGVNPLDRSCDTFLGFAAEFASVMYSLLGTF